MRHILNMGILLVMAAVLVTSGCATTGSGVSDTDQIGALLEEWKEAILAEDADRLLATYSENFSHDGADYDAEDKAGLREFIDWGIQGDRYADAQINIDDADIAIEEGTATVYPIEYTNWEGTVTIELTLTKEKAGWLITDMVIEGM
jgi:ketosteroid isomerase-like protein